MHRFTRSHVRKFAGVLLVLAVLAPLAVRTPALAADQSLVLQALQVIEANYIDPVDTVKSLNAAIAGLRAQIGRAHV